jgi:16S rRNA (cytidine1402-2'-O)-methyltransferase
VSEGRLVVCATPIGNLGDISERLRNTLASADIVFAEDTRRTAKLLRHLVINVPMASLFVGNEAIRTEQLVEAVKRGEKVVLVSDAGMPTVSDPGAAAVRAVRDAGLPVSVVPGPSAVTTALALSGFGADRFSFEGFLPRKGKARAERINEIANDERPVVIFASPHRLPEDLRDLEAGCGGARLVAVLRELTKLHEESWVGQLGSAVQWWTDEVKGEVTIVVGPAEMEGPSIQEAIEEARQMVARGGSIRVSARTIAEEMGVSRREVYEALIDDQDSS